MGLCRFGTIVGDFPCDPGGGGVEGQNYKASIVRHPKGRIHRRILHSGSNAQDQGNSRNPGLQGPYAYVVFRDPKCKRCRRVLRPSKPSAIESMSESRWEILHGTWVSRACVAL